MENTNNIFEIATRNKYRFPYKGLVSVEDLWDLSPVQLDVVFKELNKHVQKAGEESLMSGHTENKELMTKISIVKCIFNAKEVEAKAHEAAVENAAKRQKILEVLAKKQNDSLLNKSEEELLEMLNSIG